jgi:hypothetical protein
VVVVAKRLKYSRWRRLPGAFRFHESKPPDLDQEEERISLFLSHGLLEKAAELAGASGLTVQQYCERQLGQAIELEWARRRLGQEEARRGTLEGLRAIADDPDYLKEWEERAHPTQFVNLEPESTRGGEVGLYRTSETTPVGFTPDSDQPPPPIPEPKPEPPPMRRIDHPAVSIVMRHAGLEGEEDFDGLLPCLRRGEAIGPASARELLLALESLEAELRGQTVIDRFLAYALHRLAFEGQVLLTDAWPSGLVDSATIDVLRLVQEGVDRVLSGADIRYYPREAGPELPP